MKQLPIINIIKSLWKVYETRRVSDCHLKCGKSITFFNVWCSQARMTRFKAKLIAIILSSVEVTDLAVHTKHISISYRIWQSNGLITRNSWSKIDKYTRHYVDKGVPVHSDSFRSRHLVQSVKRRHVSYRNSVVVSKQWPETRSRPMSMSFFRQRLWQSKKEMRRVCYKHITIRRRMTIIVMSLDNQYYLLDIVFQTGHYQ